MRAVLSNKWKGAVAVNINVNERIIKELCGAVSFKRGEVYWRAGKVVLDEVSAEEWRGVVKGAEDFFVTIAVDAAGQIVPSCSCPTLGDFSKSCQHVAAVLLAMKERESQVGSDELMALFERKPARRARHQFYFEERDVLDIRVVLDVCRVSGGERLFGLRLEVAGVEVESVRIFVASVLAGDDYEGLFNPERHCFTREVEAVLTLLRRIAQDSAGIVDDETMIVPPSAWRELRQLLVELPDEAVFVQVGGATWPLRMIDGTLPVQFVVDIEESVHRLLMRGGERMVLLAGYYSVLMEGALYKLEVDDFERLEELYSMLVKTTTNSIVIGADQLPMFLNKVVPGLKKLGRVVLEPAVLASLQKTPLKPKLYLDRLRGRLLAGLEFHYEHVVIDPFNEVPDTAGQMIVRDFEQERAIMELLEESGFTRSDGGYFMQNEELEYDFLYHRLSDLQQLVEVFATTAVRNRLVKKDQFPKMTVRVLKERTNWLEFKFAMDGISDAHVKEILQALEMKQKYYKLPNESLLSLETKEMEEIRRFLLAGPEQDDEYGSTLRLPLIESLRFLELIEESEVFSPEESFRDIVGQLLEPEKLTFKVPSELVGVLRDYQVQGFKWMKQLSSYGFGGVLADDMGLGKTVQSIAFIVSEIASIRDSGEPVLIVCPSAVTYNWLQELAKFAPALEAIIVDGTVSERRSLLSNLAGVDVVITSYPLVRRDVMLYEKLSFHTVFFDEAQAFKNPMTQTARAVKKIEARNRFGLTGTPVENNREELWALYYVVFPQLFQGLRAYSELRRTAIARRVRPFLLRRMKSNVLTELPSKNESVAMSELLPSQKELYAAVLAKLREDTLKHLDQETLHVNKIRILAGLTRLRQICCHPGLFVDGYTGGSAKFEQLLEILEESRMSGRRVLVFSQFTTMLALIGRELVQREQAYFYLDGQTSSEERVQLCQRFNEGERDVFLISLKAGGTGLNLTGADTVILYDLWWNPAVEEQAADRAYRMGQQQDVEVIKLIARGTIEEKMNELQAKKRSLIAELIDGDAAAAGNLTEEDIREILMV